MLRAGGGWGGGGRGAFGIAVGLTCIVCERLKVVCGVYRRYDNVSSKRLHTECCRCNQHRPLTGLRTVRAPDAPLRAYFPRRCSCHRTRTGFQGLLACVPTVMIRMKMVGPWSLWGDGVEGMERK